MGRRRSVDPEVLAKETEVVKLRRGGLTWDVIADRVGYKYPSSAQTAYQRAAARIVADDVEAIRKLESERLDLAQSAIWGGVLAGNVPAIHALIRIQERRAKLLGLDQPIRQQIEVTTYDGDSIDAELARLVHILDSGTPLPLDAPASETGTDTV